jgi:hypothetical protein
MSCSESERCYNKNRTCTQCVHRQGYVESYDWFVDKADVISNANEELKRE